MCVCGEREREAGRGGGGGGGRKQNYINRKRGRERSIDK